MKINFKIIKRDLMLLLNTPREYLYSFTYPSYKKIIISKYDKRVYQFGRNITKKVNSLLPKLKIHFYGSAALKICGQRDIDLFAECDPKEFDLNIKKLVNIFGKNYKRRNSFVEWNTKVSNIDVEFILIDPKSKMFAVQRDTFKSLKKNKTYLNEYAQIKMNANKLNYREYQRRRLEFFNRILGLNKFKL